MESSSDSFSVLLVPAWYLGPRQAYPLAPEEASTKHAKHGRQKAYVDLRSVVFEATVSWLRRLWVDIEGYSW